MTTSVCSTGPGFLGRLKVNKHSYHQEKTPHTPPSLLSRSTRPLRPRLRCHRAPRRTSPHTAHHTPHGPLVSRVLGSPSRSHGDLSTPLTPSPSTPPSGAGDVDTQSRVGRTKGVTQKPKANF